MAYPTRATLVAASSLSALTGAAATAQDAWYASAKRAVEAFTNQRFDKETLTRKLDGNGGTLIGLDRRLAEIDTLATVNGIDASQVELNERHDALYISSQALLGGTWLERAMREGPLIFPGGTGTVEITGDWGWSDAELPATADTPIAIAMRLDMEDQALAADHGLAQTVRAQARLGLRDVQEGSLSATITPPDVLLSVEAQFLLEDYIWQPQAVRA